MSRHSLQPLGGSGAVYEIAIGWDRSLASYFVIVFGLPGDHDRDHRGAAALELFPLVWRGTSRAELATPDAAIEIAAAYAAIPEGLAAQLAHDREAETASVADPVRAAFLVKFWPERKGRPWPKL
jgi:hypothetical protein